MGGWTISITLCCAVCHGANTLGTRKGVCKHGKVRGGEATSVETVNFPDWKAYVRTKCPELVVY